VDPAKRGGQPGIAPCSLPSGNSVEKVFRQLSSGEPFWTLAMDQTVLIQRRTIRAKLSREKN
jgi:hypothetical protein